MCIMIDSLIFLVNMSSPRSSRMESDLLRRLSSITLTPLSPSSTRIHNTAISHTFKKMCPPAPRAASSSLFCWSQVTYIQPASKYNHKRNE